MAVRERRNILNIPIVDTTIDWYASAVEELKRRDVDDPTSWWYQGAIHGDPGFQNPPADKSRFWDQCQHQTWYFLPWHRAYLAAFEALIAKTVADLGGPSDWALPYWDYTESLLVQPEARMLPAPFRDQFRADGTENPLWAPRNVGPDGVVPLSNTDVSLDALSEPFFTDPAGFEPGFGGPATGFNHFGRTNGQLERVPHNAVHVRIGGWMADPDTAALDPIFWLHHCNIDRLWEEWLIADALHFNPFEDAWVSGQSFEFHDGNGVAFAITCGQTEDTTRLMHGYKYDTITVPPFIIGTESPEGVPVLAGTDPELAGSSAEPVQLGAGRTQASVQLSTEGLSKSFTESALDTPGRVFLRLENVRGSGVPSDYEVMLDIEGDDVEPLKVGVLTTFGIAKASAADDEHGGAGITLLYEITFAAEKLKLTEESTSEVRVFFEEIATGPQPESGQLEIPGVTPKDLGDPGVEVGRIAIYFE